MNSKSLWAAIAVACTLPLLFTSSCRRVEEASEEHTETRSVELDRSELVQVKVAIGAGELKVRGGSPKLMDGEFRFHGNAMPEIRYDSSSFRGKLIVSSTPLKDGLHFSPPGGEWDIALNDSVPMDLEIHMGAGESNLDLGKLNLRDLAVHLGVGQVKLDLRGHPTRNMNVKVFGGFGEAVVYVPNDVGVRVEAKGGIGSIDMRGLTNRGGYHENALYAKAPVRMDVQIHGGVGSIKVYAE